MRHIKQKGEMPSGKNGVGIFTLWQRFKISSCPGVYNPAKRIPINGSFFQHISVLILV